MKRTLILLLGLIFVLGIVGCGGSAVSSTPASTGMTPGVYKVSAPGCYGDFTINVTVGESSIDDIELVKTKDSLYIGQRAQKMVIDKVLEHQSTEVDGMTGATISSMTMKWAIRKALTEAGASEDMFAIEKTSEVLPNCKGDISDFEPDIIVVGAGISGLTASLTAAKEGQKVLVLEHMSHFGGSSMYSGGSVTSAGSETQKAMGTVNDPEIFYKWLCDQAGDNQWFRPELAYASAYNSGPATDLLTEMGVKWSGLKIIGGEVTDYDTSDTSLTTIAAALYPAGYGWDIFDQTQDSIQRFVDEGNYAYLLNTTVTELITDADGAVIGVKAKSRSGAETEYYAKAVILCSGGYAANNKMLDKQLTKYARSTVPASIGNMFEAAENVGAVMFGTDFIRADGGVLPTKDTNGFDVEYEIKYNLPGVVWLNDDGVRLYNEAAGGQNKWHPWYDSENNTVYVVMNQAIVDSTNVLYYGNYAGKSEDEGNVLLQKFAADNYFVYKGDSIEEAAEKAGLDPETVSDTLAVYNEYCATGIDKDFNKPAKKLISLEEGPYYIFETIPSIKSTLGGLRIDDHARVLNSDDEPIKGLYAAGEVTGIASSTGFAWYSGICLQSGASFGYLAAHSAIKD